MPWPSLTYLHIGSALFLLLLNLYRRSHIDQSSSTVFLPPPTLLEFLKYVYPAVNVSIHENEKIITLGQYLHSDIFHKLKALEDLVPNYYVLVDGLEGLYNIIKLRKV
jgi:hypothetical protein